MADTTLGISAYLDILDIQEVKDGFTEIIDSLTEMGGVTEEAASTMTEALGGTSCGCRWLKND